jgi:hypothetical protein
VIVPTVTLAIIKQAFGEESMSPTWVFEWHAQFKAGETGDEQSQEHGQHFL